MLLDEASVIDDLFPFTWTRPVVDIRIGILTIREKWALLGNPLNPSSSTDQIRSSTNPVNPNPATAATTPTLPANILPTAELVAALRRRNRQHNSLPLADILSRAIRIQYPWHIFELNGEALRSDFTLITAGRASQPLPSHVQTASPENIFIEEGARIHPCMLNASTGPIYIGPDTEIMEGALIRGPFALCEGAVVKMGTKIYGATTVGPYCTVGGEIKNSVLFGYSNKGTRWLFRRRRTRRMVQPGSGNLEFQRKEQRRRSQSMEPGGRSTDRSGVQMRTADGGL